MIQEKCISEQEQTERKLSDKLLMQKYKAIMTKAYSLNSELLQWFIIYPEYLSVYCLFDTNHNQI